MMEHSPLVPPTLLVLAEQCILDLSKDAERLGPRLEGPLVLLPLDHVPQSGRLGLKLALLGEVVFKLLRHPSGDVRFTIPAGELGD